MEQEKELKRSGSGATKKCDLFAVVIFLAAIATGTACSICSKTMMELQGVGITGEVEVFSKPIFQTFGMFVGMMFGLVMHWFVLFFKIPFPGYDHVQSATKSASTGPNYGAIPSGAAAVDTPAKESKGTPMWMYFFLAIPSIFDLAATALCMMGLRYLDVSIYQLLRGSGIVFVAIMKQNVLGDHLYKFQWLGVFWNVVAVLFIGATAVLNSNDNADLDPKEAMLGIFLVLAGAFVQALQFVFEEKVMTMEDAVPPLLLIGAEGLWGTVLCLLVVYPIAYLTPGSDHGSYEDPFNTWTMFMDSPTIQIAFGIYFFAIFGYNFFAVMVTYLLNSIWHSILDNFRPITVWLTDLAIFYLITETGDFGEPWTKYSYIQLFGMFVLLYGTAVYNAPNAGSILLKGEWFSFGIDLSHEYREIEIEMAEEALDAEWQARAENFLKKRMSSSFASPRMSVHTQALAGYGAAHI